MTCPRCGEMVWQRDDGRLMSADADMAALAGRLDWPLPVHVCPKDKMPFDPDAKWWQTEPAVGWDISPATPGRRAIVPGVAPAKRKKPSGGVAI